MEHLILKYLQNDLSKAEALELKAWLEKDQLNRKVFENIVGEWKLSGEDIETSKAAVKKNLMSKNRRLEEANQKVPGVWDYVVRIAAVLLIGMSVTFIAYFALDTFNDNTVSSYGILLEKESARGQKLTFDLPDGSIVKLNSGSKLSYPESFSADSREVRLTGEAFFDVARDEERPFRILSDEVKVEVLGTSFNVRSFPGDNQVTVAVKTGKVRVSSKLATENLVLTPKEMATYKPSENQFSKEQIVDDELVFGWVDQTMVLNDLELSEVLKVVSRWYGVEFKVEKEIDTKKRFTAKYKNPSLKAVMESLSYVYEFKYEINERIITIK